MRILCCYTSLHQATARSLARFAPDAEIVCVEGDPFGYWREITARWDGSEDLMIVEQDIEIRADVIAAFLGCPSPWCTFGYEIHGDGTWLDMGLGCVRFRPAVQLAASPEQVQQVPGSCQTCNPSGAVPGENRPGCWRHLDCKIAWTLQPLGFDACVHEPEVRHWSPQVMGRHSSLPQRRRAMTLARNGVPGSRWDSSGRAER